MKTAVFGVGIDTARYGHHVNENPAATQDFSSAMDSLRRCVSAIESMATERTMAVNQLHNLLASVFPELAVYVSDVASSHCLKVLEKYALWVKNESYSPARSCLGLDRSKATNTATALKAN